MFKPKLSLIAVACLSGVSALNAQAQAQAQTTEEPTRIVITAKGQQTEAELTSVSHIITSDDIERTQASDLTEVLQATSGVSISRNGGRGSVSSFFVRGTTSNQVVVLVDGMRIGSGTLGSTELGHIPAEAIERIELLKGPLSGLYGADAIGGVIQVFTKKGAKKARYASIEVGSFGHQRLAAGLSQKGFNLSFSTEQNDGIDATTVLTGNNDDEDAFEETSLNLSGVINVNDKSTIELNAYHTENDIEFDNTFGTDTGYETSNEVNSLNAAYKTSSNNIEWTSRLGYSTNETDTPVFAVFNSSRFETKRLNASTQADISLNNGSVLVVGLDHRDEEVDSDASFAETERDNTGFYGQYQLSAGKAGYVANVRYDDNSAYGSNTNGSVAVNYQLNDSTRLTASYGTAFRAPTFNELYFPFAGNPDIQPEESTSTEIGVRGGTNGRQWRVSLYDTQVENLIQFPAPNFTATNVAEASLQGLELEYGASVANWYLKTSLDLLDAVDEATDKQLVRRPEKTLKVSADRAFNKLNVGVDLIAEKGRFDGGEELDSWERVDVRGHYDINPKFKVSAKVSNLLDEEYQLAKGFNTEGRAVQVSGKYKF